MLFNKLGLFFFLYSNFNAQQKVMHMGYQVAEQALVQRLPKTKTKESLCCRGAVHFCWITFKAKACTEFNFSLYFAWWGSQTHAQYSRCRRTMILYCLLRATLRAWWMCQWMSPNCFFALRQCGSRNLWKNFLEAVIVEEKFLPNCSYNYNA